MTEKKETGKKSRIVPATPEKQKALAEEGILIFFQPRKKEPVMKEAEEKQKDSETNLKP